jgi:putative peptidoglycan lipid II flippase
MTSRILGLVREIFYTSFMGTGWVADAFNLAFMVPNLFRRLLGEGALTAAFIPIFKEKEKLSGEKDMWQAANAVISGLVAATSLIALAGMAAISLVLLLRLDWPQVLHGARLLGEVFPYVAVMGLVAVGIFLLGNRDAAFGGLTKGLSVGTALLSVATVLGLVLLAGSAFGTSGDGKTLLMLRLLRVMFPYVVLVCLAAVLMGMLNARGHFFIPAMGATMLNVVMIVSVLVIAPLMGRLLEEQIFGLAVGVLIAGVAQALFQWPLLRKEGFHLSWVSPWRDETVRRVVTQMIPGAVGVAAFQINVLITQSMGFWVGSGVVSSFTVAVRLMELPQGVFGISLATYLLPTLSGLAAEKKYPEFRSTLGQGLNWLIFVNLLAAVLLFTLAEPMVRLLFERGRFIPESTSNSALALKCLAPGLVAFSIVNILARAFYALGDVQTPMRISVFCLAINVVFSAVLVFRFKQAGLGIANTMSAVVNMSLLFYALSRKLKTLEAAVFLKHLGVLLGATALAGVVSWQLAKLWTERLGHHSLFLRLGEVFVPLTAAALVYCGVSMASRTGHLDELIGILRRRLGK